jgi:hypothetical protein
VKGVAQDPIHFPVKVVKIKLEVLRQTLSNGRLAGTNHAAKVNIQNAAALVLEINSGR